MPFGNWIRKLISSVVIKFYIELLKYYFFFKKHSTVIMITKSYVINTVYNEGVDNVIFIFSCFCLIRILYCAIMRGKTADFEPLTKI